MLLHFLHDTDGLFWIVLVFSIAAIIWVITSSKNVPYKKIIFSLRIFVLFSLIVLLLQPKIMWRKEKTYPLQWNIYADKSVSMAYHRSISPPSYIQGVTGLVNEIRHNNNSQFFVYDYRVEKHESDDFELVGEATDLSVVFDHIDEMKNQLAGAVIISDGRITKGSHDYDRLSDFSIPVHTIGVGDSLPMVDVAIQSISAPTVVIKDEGMDINVTLFSTGKIHDKVNVLLYDNKTLIGSKYISLSGEGKLADVRFRIVPQELGEKNYRIKISVLKEEVNIKNNQLSFTTTILKNKYRVALITGAANFNTGPIKKIIKQYSDIELNHFIQKGNKYDPGLQLFWSQPYELIVFDNFPLKPISDRWQQFLAKKLVAQKSSLMWFAGPNITDASAESLYPFFHLTGKANNGETKDYVQWYWSDRDHSISGLEGIFSDYKLYANNSLPPLKPKMVIEPEESISTLAYFNPPFSHPLMTAGEVEGLRSFVWTSSDLNSLYYKLTKTENENMTEELLHNLMSWLMRTSGDRDLYFRMDKGIYQQGEEIRITGRNISDKDEDVFLSQTYINLKQGNKLVKTHELNFNPDKKQWEGNFIAGKPGEYDYEIISTRKDKSYNQTGNFIIDESQIELNKVSVNKFVLETISQKTKGKYVPWDSRKKILEHVNPKQKSEIVIKTAQLNENALLVTLLIIMLAIEWSIRRFLGLN